MRYTAGRPSPPTCPLPQTAEHKRLAEAARGTKDWRRWGPYLSERQWGTVREDYSPDGAAWEYFPHDHARSRAYRWGEDGIGGLSDNHQRLCLAIALWNERDPILKERLFGLTANEGNHGEDVKERYYYLDATPTHSYLKMLYKYPQREFPYARLVEENRRRGKKEPEFELLDTGVFDDDRYFDVFVEYGKAAPNDILLLITVFNRGPEGAPIHLLPQIWFRNRWSWKGAKQRPSLSVGDDESIVASDAGLGELRLYVENGGEMIFCENDTNPRLHFGAPDAQGYFKDAFHDYVIRRKLEAVNPSRTGTKAALHFSFDLPAGGDAHIRARLTDRRLRRPFQRFDRLLERRRQETDEFYALLQHEIADPDARNVQRQALAGMIWNKQFYHFNVAEWLKGDPAQPPPQRFYLRNSDWRHLNNAEVLSMPDKWEYPWYAAWDLAFHCIALALIDPEFAKEQLVTLGRVWYLHPSGQIPAYEWNFSDVNPPVHAWAAWRVFQIDRRQRCDDGDLDFLERVFHKLMLNFTWWVNRKDFGGRNIFQGGFLGLDNVGVFDRSAPLPTGGYINQADGTSWMAMYCLNLMRIALELALHNRVYEDAATKFFEHFLYIAAAMTNIGGGKIGLWNEEDEFYYDVLEHEQGDHRTLRLRSMVGLTPLFAVETLEPEMLNRLPDFSGRLEWFLRHRKDLAQLVSRWNEPGRGERRLLSLLRGHRMKCLLRRMLDETQFLSKYGVRSLSREYFDRPYVFDGRDATATVAYQPGESACNLFGGNSNWRGPVWFPVNYLIIESLQKFHHYYGDDFLIECPTGSGDFMTINDVADELARRLIALFLRDDDGRRPVYGDHDKLKTDPHFRDYLLFYEYFHGENGRGVGASHQTGWTGLVAKLIQPRKKPRASGNR